MIKCNQDKDRGTPQRKGVLNMERLIEHTYGNHIYMKMKLDNGRVEEIDVYYRKDGEHYVTSADHGAELDKTEEQKQQRKELRAEIIRAFKELY